jgi:hypothetical protein
MAVVLKPARISRGSGSRHGATRRERFSIQHVVGTCGQNSPTAGGPRADFYTRGLSAQAHLCGRVAAALMASAPDLFAHPPVIERVDILASTLPG